MLRSVRTDHSIRIQEDSEDSYPVQPPWESLRLLHLLCSLHADLHPIPEPVSRPGLPGYLQRDWIDTGIAGRGGAALPNGCLLLFRGQRAFPPPYREQIQYGPDSLKAPYPVRSNYEYLTSPGKAWFCILSEPPESAYRHLWEFWRCRLAGCPGS